MLTSSSIFITLSLFLFQIPRVHADAAYVYYEDAECISGNYIEGKLIFAYDTSSMKGHGFTLKNYNGPCKYFEGGRFDFMYGSPNGSFMKNGYCVRCQGMIGCTTTKNSCKGFSTVIPYNSYTMTMNSTMADGGDDDEIGYDMDDDLNDELLDSNNSSRNGDDDDLTKSSANTISMSEGNIYQMGNMTTLDNSTENSLLSDEMMMVQEAVFDELQMYNHGQSWIAIYSVIGIFCGILSFMAIFVTANAIRRLNKRSGAVSEVSLMDNDHGRDDPEMNRESRGMMS